MGHANLSNLSDLFINLLYARGKLTIGQAVEVAGKRKETLHASEGQYDAESGMVGMGFEDLLSFLTCDSRSAHQNWGWSGQWDGPFVEPVLDPLTMKPKGAKLTTTLLSLLKECQDKPADEPLHAVAADAVAEAGYTDWAAYVRDLPRMRVLYEVWKDDDTPDDEDWWEILDRIPWQFASGKRMQYRDIPRLGKLSDE